MTAKQLEDFIQVIETAERMSLWSSTDRSCIVKSPAATSILSYPTDLYSRCRPKWQGVSDAISSSLVPVIDQITASDKKPESEHRSPTTCSLLRTSRRLSGAQLTAVDGRPLSATNSPASIRKIATVDVAPAEKDSLDYNLKRHRDTLLKLQKPSLFGRVQAKDLSPVIPPSPAHTSKAKNRSLPFQSPVKVKSESKKTAECVSSSSPPDEKAYSGFESQEGKKETVYPDEAAQQGEEVQQDEVLQQDETLQLEKIAPGELLSPDANCQALNKSEHGRVETSPRSASPGSPRSSPPKPSPRVIIRQSSVMVHDHTSKKSDDQSQITDWDQKRDRKPQRLTSQKQHKDQSMAKELHSTKTETRRRRPASAPSLRKKVISNKLPDPISTPIVDLRSYSRSLRLLGLDVPSNSSQVSKLAHQEVVVRTQSPKTRTRLIKRSQSFSDLRQKVDSRHEIPRPEFESIKDNLTQAVFEQWYFKKLKELLDKRKALELDKEKLEQQNQEQQQKKATAQQEFQKWIEAKNSRRRRTARSMLKKQHQEEEQRLAHKARIAKAEQDWKARKKLEEKALLEKRKELSQREQQEREDKAQRKREAEIQFKKWKTQLHTKLGTKMSESQNQHMDDIQLKREQARQKKEDAESAFKAWKQKKDLLHRQGCLKKQQGAKQSVANQGTVDKDRLKAAEEAYEAWLEYVEQRDIEARLTEHQSILRSMWRPPWYPA